MRLVWVDEPFSNQIYILFALPFSDDLASGSDD